MELITQKHSTLTTHKKWIAFQTIARKEIRQAIQLWAQTLLLPMGIATLYFLIFGNIIGSRIGPMDSYPYINFIAPGLIMMPMLTSSYTASASSFFSAKFQLCIEEILISPTPNYIILLGYLTGGISRGFLAGSAVSIITLLFTTLPIHSVAIILIAALLSTSICSLGGLINAILATKFEDVVIVPLFILTPLTYLGGVFYTTTILPPFWQRLSLADPITYIIDIFRYGFLGGTNSHLASAFVVMVISFLGLLGSALILLNKGIRLRK